MARKDKERITDRTRPHRKAAKPSRGRMQPDAWTNPVVLIAVGGLILAIALGIGFMLGDRATTSQTAEAPEEMPTPEALAPTLDLGALDDLPDEGVDESEAPDEADADDAGEEAAGEAAMPGAAKQYAAPEDQGLDPENTAYFATIETPHGPIVAELWPEVAPETVNSFVFLAREGFFDDLTFHRVVPGFVIQGGDPEGRGSGGPGYSIPAEFNAADPVPHRIGTLAMARSSDPDSAGSQFYIVLEDSPNASGLDGEYTVFGHVIEGMDAVGAVAVGDVMSSVTIEERPIEESVVSPDDIREGNLPEYEQE